MREVTQTRVPKVFRKFAKQVETWLAEHGAKRLPPNSCYEWELETEAGKLLIAVDINSRNLVSVFQRFEDLERAKLLGVVPGNSYTGKRNFHYGVAEVVSGYAWAVYEGSMESILIKEYKP